MTREHAWDSVNVTCLPRERPETAGEPDAQPVGACAAVVVGYQQSQGAARALAWAAARAARMSLPLHIVRAWRWDEDFRDVALRSTEAQLTAVARSSMPALPVAPRQALIMVSDGEPAGDLEQAAADGAMIVVGRRRIAMRERLFTGSVSRHLVAVSDHPVVVVPDLDAVDRRGPVVAGVTDSPASISAVTWAAEQASLFGEELLLVAVHRPAEDPVQVLGGDYRGGHISANDSIALLADAEAAARQHGGDGLAIHTEAASGIAESVLLARCAEASMVVLGKHRQSWPGQRVGSVADGILSHSEVPIAVIPT